MPGELSNDVLVDDINGNDRCHAQLAEANGSRQRALRLSGRIQIEKNFLQLFHVSSVKISGLRVLFFDLFTAEEIFTLTFLQHISNIFNSILGLGNENIFERIRLWRVNRFPF